MNQSVSTLEPAKGSDIPPPGGTKLITDPSQPPAYTIERLTDARTALTRGLADYLQQQVAVADGGREVRFKRVYSTWADPEKFAEYPSATIWTPEEGIYDGHSFTPTLDPRYQVDPPNGPYLVKMAEFAVALMVDIWTNDTKMRQELTSLCESVLNPVDFMYGLRLELPHYFNERATYSMEAMKYWDDEEHVIRRYRRSSIRVQAQVPVVKVSSFPLAQPKVKVESVTVNPIVLSAGQIPGSSQ
jgi:hypothetical protein